MSEIGDIASILMLNGGGSLPRKGDNPVLEALIDGALKKSQEPGFFSREAGQNRRAWLDETVNYFTPPELLGPLGLLNEANPVTSMERASTASQTMLAPETSGWGRVAAGGDMLSNMAGIVAPAMVAGKAGMPAVNAIEEGLLGWAPGMPAAAGNFVADEFGGLRLYHGSPHDFDKFSMDKIGTGEGAQAYGHGLYFAENEGVARNYRDNLSGQQFGTPLVSQDVRGWLESAGGDYQKAATEAKAFLSEYGGQMGRDEEKTLREAIALMDKGKQSWGRMYEVDVNANPEDFLDWDAPLSAQPQKVRDWFDSRGITPGFAGNQSGAELLQAENGVLGAEGTTSAMREVGVPGIKYLDHGSRFNAVDGTGPATNTRNYVVFDENLINIVKKYGVAGAATMLGVSQAEVAQAMEGQQ